MPKKYINKYNTTTKKKEKKQKTTASYNFLKFSEPWPKTLIWKLAVISEYSLLNSLLPFVEINF